jgi:hypothetical protein
MKRMNLIENVRNTFFKKAPLTMQSLWDTISVFEQEIKAVKKKKSDYKERELRDNIFEFLIKLKDEGILVSFNDKDDGGKLTKRRFMKFSTDKMFKEYVVETVKAIEKEVIRREKEDERNKEK